MRKWLGLSAFALAVFVAYSSVGATLVFGFRRVMHADGILLASVLLPATFTIGLLLGLVLAAPLVLVGSWLFNWERTPAA